VGGEKGSAEYGAGPGGFALKFYTEKAIGNMTATHPVFFIRDR